MKRTLTLLLFAAPLLAGPIQTEAAIVDGVAAVVNEEVITLSEVDEEGAPLYEQIRRSQPENLRMEIAKVRREVLEQIINARLMEQAIRRLEISASREEVAAAIEDVMRQNGISQAALVKALEKQGLTLADYQKQIRRQIEKAKLINRQIKSRVELTDKDLKNYYLKHKEEFRREEEIRVRHLLIAVPGDADESKKAALRAKAEALYARIQSGEDLAVLAMKNSQGPSAEDGGDLGHIRKGETVPEFERAAFALRNTGDLAPILETSAGFHIIRLEDRREEKIRSYDEVQEELQTVLYKKRLDEEFQSWINKLRENAYVEIKL